MAVAPVLESLLRCPRCRSNLRRSETDAYSCSAADCVYHSESFPMIGGTPALIDFARSIISREALETRQGASAIDRSNIVSRVLRGAVYGSNHLAEQMCAHFTKFLRMISVEPRVLIIGGGERGAGTASLYAARDIRVIGTDIYTSAVVDVVADAHQLPFQDAAFDGVWIQAVLEHVLDPSDVVSEIHRVLKPEGLVYAETPFMQQVHEGAFDFTRFSRSGHRWLFRNFAEIGSGNVGGPGQSLIWAIRYLFRSLSASNKGATLGSFPFFWLRYLDLFCRRDYAADAANGVYFLGRRSTTALAPRDMITYYPGPRQ
jgi:SAM-dependent methyltransferase